MQCVAHEANFVHYYSNSHRYPLTNFCAGIVNTFEADTSSVTSLDIFNKKSDKRRDNHYVTSRSPYRHKKTNREPNNIRMQATHVQERVGLYRNVPSNKRSEDVQKEVDINSINLTLINRGNQDGNFGPKQGTKPKNVRKSDEPLRWILPKIENKCD